MYDIVGKRKWFFLLSGTLILLGIGAMVYSSVRFGSPLRIGVDFTGGSRFVIRFADPALTKLKDRGDKGAGHGDGREQVDHRTNGQGDGKALDNAGPKGGAENIED